MPQRAYPRTKVEKTISYAPSSVTVSDEKHGAQTIDIGQGGVCIVSNERLEPGSIVRIRFSVDETNINISSFAEVRWAVPHDGKFKIGLQFLV